MDINATPQITLAGRRASRSPDCPLRLGIIGCGYVTRMSHVPAVRQTPDFALTALADVREETARSLGEQYQVPIITTDYRDLFDQVDAVIVAVPHQMHAPVALDFLNRGIHVLVEKPMATSEDECQRMIQAASATGARLTVGLMRRFFDSSRIVKRMLDSRFLGRPQHFEAEEAVIFDNFEASPFSVQPPFGGVLFDTGPHTLDLILWWLGDFAGLHYWDDARGGVEANCRIEITTRQGVTGTVVLSRTRRLENKIKVECEYGRIEFPTLDPNQATIEMRAFPGPVQRVRLCNENDDQALVPFFSRQLANFAGSILRDEPLEIPGEEGMRGIQVIEQCKKMRQPLTRPAWEEIHL